MKDLAITQLIQELQKEEKEAKSSLALAISLEDLKKIAIAYEGEDRVVSSTEIYERLKNEKPLVGIPTGFSDLDSILKGFYPKQLITVSGPTKNGKTQFCVELTSKLKDYHPLWLPFEEPAEELIQKFIDRNEEPPVFYTPEHVIGNTLLWVEKKIIESIAKYNSQIVFIDHLHFLVEMTGNDNISLRIGETMRSLKKLAKKWNVVIVIIAHLTKTRIETPPDINDLRDSSFIGQESDTVIMVWRESYRDKGGQIVITNNTNISVQANRKTGKTGNVKMVYENGHYIQQAWKGVEESNQEEIDRQNEVWGFTPRK